MSTVTIRVAESTRGRLLRLAEDRGRSIADVVDEAVRHLEDEAFWIEVNASYARLRADPVASAEYDDETARLEASSLADFTEPPWDSAACARSLGENRGRARSGRGRGTSHD